MVSIRRRRLMQLCAGRDSVPIELPKSIENGYTVENPQHNKPVSVHPITSDHASPPKLEEKSDAYLESTNASGSGMSSGTPTLYYPGKEVKHRKRHKRKHYEDQEPCIMRGVYFKNMKWQAAIKVDKKQIHLGTVRSQEEAARLYDRAAFMCGREPNFELSSEEKKELSKYNWEEFLTMTRSAINNKRTQRKGAGRRKEQETPTLSSGSERERRTGGSSMSEDDVSASA